MSLCDHWFPVLPTGALRSHSLWGLACSGFFFIINRTIGLMEDGTTVAAALLGRFLTLPSFLDTSEELPLSRAFTLSPVRGIPAGMGFGLLGTLLESPCYEFAYFPCWTPCRLA